jgi:spore germination protein GerM
MRRTAVIAVAAVLVLAGAGCGIAPQGNARVERDDEVPFGLLQPDVPPLVTSTTSAPAETVGLCFVRGNKLVVVPAALGRDPSLEDVLAALADVPGGAPRSVHTALGERTVVRSARLASGIASVDLATVFSSLGSDDQLLAIAQMVCSLTLRPGVGQVSFTLQGAPIAVPRGSGSITDEPVSRDDYRRLLG